MTTEAPTSTLSLGVPTSILRDRLLDAVMTAKCMLPSPKTGELRSRPIPAEHLRTYVAVLLIIERDCASSGSHMVNDRHKVTTWDLLEVLPPRRSNSQDASIDSDSLFRSLAWLESEGFVGLEAIGSRRLAHWVTLAVNADAAEPAWPHARKIVLDAVRLKRLVPARVALLGHLGYGAGAEGGRRVLPSAEVEEACGLCMKTVLKHLEGLGPQHGLASWSCEGPVRERVLVIELCESDETVVKSKPLARLHHSFAEAVHASTEEGGSDGAGDVPEETGPASAPAAVETPKRTPKSKPNEEELREEAIRLYRLLWHKDLVEQAVKLAEAQLKEGRKISLTRRIKNFYLPVWKLQEQYKNPGLIRHALEKTIDGPPLRQPRTNGWVGYLAVVCKNSEAGFKGGGVVAGTNADKAVHESIETRQKAMQERLSSAYALNKAGETSAARALLAEMVAEAKTVAELFDGNEARTTWAIRLAYKGGTSDFSGAVVNKYAPVDYLPEWTCEMATAELADGLIGGDETAVRSAITEADDDDMMAAPAPASPMAPANACSKPTFEPTQEVLEQMHAVGVDAEELATASLAS
jgi:hypothetical protein